MKQEKQQRGMAYWFGWHAGAVAKALKQLEAVDAAGESLHRRSDVIEALRTTWDTFVEDGGTYAEQFADTQEKMWIGFVIEAATGEPQALRATYAGAVSAVDQAESYWDDAAASGHSAAPRSVGLMYPFRIRQVTQEQWNLIEDMQPVLDREP